MAVSDAPRQDDLDRCVHCGLCLNACPTYRELHVEMDSPRGRIYQMVQVANGAPITDAYQEHIDLCLACRGCETACPSGVKYGRLIEAARADIEQRTTGRWPHASLANWFLIICCPAGPVAAGGCGLWIYQRSGMQRLVRKSGISEGKLREMESLAPPVETPFFYRHMGRVFPARGERKYRVALLSGCIANICFARLNEATVRVLQANGCEVTIHDGQTCCGALHVHAGLRESARTLARQNIDALADAGFDAILTNAGGCGSTLKEYDELLEHDAAYAERARRFVSLMKDVNEFLASIGLNPRMGEVRGDGHVSGFVPSGPRPARAVGSARIAAAGSRAHAEGDADVRSVLRQRGNLQRRSHRYVDGAARKKDAVGECDRRRADRNGESRLHAAASRRRGAPRARPASVARDRSAGRGLSRRR